MQPASTPLAVIGIGSNSVRLLVATATTDTAHTAHNGPHTTIQALERMETVTRLAGYDSAPDAGIFRLSSQAISDTLAAARHFARRAREMGALLTAVLATEAVRAASNRAHLTDALERDLGLPVRVITGEEEATLGWLAISASLDYGAGTEDRHIAVVDIGGGSTDLSVGQAGAGQPLSTKSLKAGSRTLMQRFSLDRAVTPDQLRAAMSALLMEVTLEAVTMRPRPQVAVVIGGTADVLEQVRHTHTHTHHAHPASDAHSDEPVTRTWLMQWMGRMSGADMKERVARGVPPDRADVKVAGAALLLSVLDAWGLRRFYTSKRNILDGFLIKMSSGAYQ